MWVGYIFRRKALSQTKSLYRRPTTHPVSRVFTSNSRKEVAPMPKNPPIVFLCGLCDLKGTCILRSGGGHFCWACHWSWCICRFLRISFQWSWTYPGWGNYYEKDGPWFGHERTELLHGRFLWRFYFRGGVRDLRVEGLFFWGGLLEFDEVLDDYL